MPIPKPNGIHPCPNPGCGKPCDCVDGQYDLSECDHICEDADSAWDMEVDYEPDWDLEADDGKELEG